MEVWTDRDTVITIIMRIPGLSMLQPCGAAFTRRVRQEPPRPRIS